MIMDINSKIFKRKIDMNKLFKKTAYILSFTAVICAAGCNDIALEIKNLTFSRIFSPIGLTATVTNKTQVTLNWTKIANATSYTIEVYADDSLTFDPAKLAKTITGITDAQLPYTIASGLIGETKYSARVKGLGENITESKWSGVFFKTDAEQIMTPVADADIQALQATFRWKAGETASVIILTPTSGTAITHTVTAAEITAGAATVTGLSEDMKYSAKLMIGTKTRGSASFTTLIDLTASGTIAVNPGDDLAAIISGASANSRIVIVANTSTNEFLIGGLTVDIAKNLTVRGYNKNFKPIVHAYFKMATAGVSLTIQDVVLDGTTATVLNLDHVLQFTTSGVAYGSYTFTNCVVKNYNKSLVSAASGIISSIFSFNLINCKVSNILTNSADCIDVRSGCLENVTLKNSTFTNCAPGRDFLRLDDGSTNAYLAGKTSVISVNNCSFSGVSSEAAHRILYIRYGAASTSLNQITFSNNVVANSVGYFTNQPSTTVTFSKNNYFNAPGFQSSLILNAKVDASGTTLDPGFVDVTNGNLTITNSTLLSQGIGAIISW